MTRLLETLKCKKPFQKYIFNDFSPYLSFGLLRFNSCPGKTVLSSEKSLERYLGQAQRVVSEPLFVLLQLPRHHLPRPEVETS